MEFLVVAASLGWVALLLVPWRPWGTGERLEPVGEPCETDFRDTTLAASRDDISYVLRLLGSVDRSFRLARAAKCNCCNRLNGDDDLVLADAQVLRKISFLGAGSSDYRRPLPSDDMVISVALLARETIRMERASLRIRKASSIVGVVGIAAATLAPSPASLTAIARPMPRLAPVTTATLPANLPVFIDIEDSNIFLKRSGTTGKKSIDAFPQ
jgi:hypothetical protein